MTTAESEKNGRANKTKIEIWKQAHCVHWQKVAIVADSIICTFCNERRIILRDASNVCLFWLICTHTQHTHTHPNRAISKFGRCEPTSRETQGSCFLFVFHKGNVCTAGGSGLERNDSLTTGG